MFVYSTFGSFISLELKELSLRSGVKSRYSDTSITFGFNSSNSFNFKEVKQLTKT